MYRHTKNHGNECADHAAAHGTLGLKSSHYLCTRWVRHLDSSACSGSFNDIGDVLEKLRNIRSEKNIRTSGRELVLCFSSGSLWLSCTRCITCCLLSALYLCASFAVPGCTLSKPLKAQLRVSLPLRALIFVHTTCGTPWWSCNFTSRFVALSNPLSMKLTWPRSRRCSRFCMTLQWAPLPLESIYHGSALNTRRKGANDLRLWGTIATTRSSRHLRRGSEGPRFFLITTFEAVLVKVLLPCLRLIALRNVVCWHPLLFFCPIGMFTQCLQCIFLLICGKNVRASRWFRQARQPLETACGRMAKSARCCSASLWLLRLQFFLFDQAVVCLVLFFLVWHFVLSLLSVVATGILWRAGGWRLRRKPRVLLLRFSNFSLFHDVLVSSDSLRGISLQEVWTCEVLFSLSFCFWQTVLSIGCSHSSRSHNLVSPGSALKHHYLLLIRL